MNFSSTMNFPCRNSPQFRIPLVTTTFDSSRFATALDGYLWKCYLFSNRFFEQTWFNFKFRQTWQQISITNILPRRNTRRKETWEVSEVIKCDKGIIFKRPKGRFPFFEKKKNNAQSMNFYKISEIITYKISEISTVRKKRKQRNRNNLNRTDLNFSWNF